MSSRPPTVRPSRLWRLRAVSILACILGATASARANTTTRTLALSGTGKDDPIPWTFYCTGGQNSGVWSTIGVPSCWELKGFGTYNYGNTPLAQHSSEQGLYQKTFTVPPDWAGQSVQIVFEGVMTDAVVKINGVSAGATHQGAFTQFRYEIGSLLNHGVDNLLEVTVSKKSANASINEAERTADYWIFGGIYRPVYLECRPPQAIQRVAIDAKANGVLTANVSLNSVTTANSLTGRVQTLAGDPVGAPFSVTLSGNPATATLTQTAAGITAWNPEAPALYNLVLELRQDGALVHTTTQRFGFRTVEVRAGDGLYVNNVKIRLKGICRHTFWPTSGRTSSPALSAQAIDLIRGLNMNAVRMSHYPPDQYFLDQCDETGLMVLDELPGWQSPPYDNATAARLVGEMVPRDVNHPSIICWDNGNEGGWNTTVDSLFATYDPQGRAVLHPGGSAFGGATSQGGFDTSHYPTYSSLQSRLASSNLVLPTEFLHGLYDGGMGAGLQDYWNLMTASPKAAGGFLWVFADEGVARTDLGGTLDTFGNNAPDGLVGPYMEKEPSYDAVRDVWSPVVVSTAPSLAAGYNGQVSLRNDYYFTNLNACSFLWETLDFPALATAGANGAVVAASGTLAGPSVAPQGSGSLQIPLPADWQTHDALRLTAYDKNGRFLRLWTWPISSTAAIAARNVPAPTGVGTFTGTSGALTLVGGDTQVSISKTTGLISAVSKGGINISLTNGPRLVSGTSTFTSLTAGPDNPDYVATATFSGNLSSITYRMRGDGWLKVSYAFSLTGSQTFIGMTFDYPTAKVTGLRWLGAGPQPVWSNRLAGPALAVWEKTANDAIPGQVWTTDPVFRGYHARFYWATLQNSEAPIDMVSETPDLFLQVLTPSNGASPQSATFTMPAGDLSLLNAISPIGTKFSGASASNIGPTSGPATAAGNYTGSFWLHFRD